jgi:hypothetical protein
MLNAYRIEKGYQHLGLTFEQPDLNDLLRQGITALDAHLIEEPGGLLLLRLALDEDGTQLLLDGEGVNGGTVGTSLLVPEVSDDLRLKFGSDGLNQLMRFHGK